MKTGKVFLLALGLFVAEIIACLVAALIYFIILTNVFRTYTSPFEFLTFLTVPVFTFMFSALSKTPSLKGALLRGVVFTLPHLALFSTDLLLNRPGFIAELPTISVILLFTLFSPLVYYWLVVKRKGAAAAP